MPDAPLLVCFDGSQDAKHALDEAARLFPGRHVIVLSVWQDVTAVPAYAWPAGPIPGLEDFFAAAREAATRIAEEGVELASAAGLSAEPAVAEAQRPVWEEIVEFAGTREAAAIVIGSRGLSGVRSMLLGSVSNGVVHNATRPVLVVRHTDA